MAAAAALVMGCAGSSGAGRDAGPSDAGAGDSDAAILPVSADRHAGALCAGGVFAHSGSLHATSCLAPVDVATGARRGDGIRWRPGPIYRVDKDEEQ